MSGRTIHFPGCIVLQLTRQLLSTQYRNAAVFNPEAEDSMDNKIVLIILAIILPPVAVFLKKGAGKDLVINILLCFVLFFPGLVHALWLVTKD